MQACSQLYERGWANENKMIGEIQREVCCTRRLGHFYDKKLTNA